MLENGDTEAQIEISIATMAMATPGQVKRYQLATPAHDGHPIMASGRSIRGAVRREIPRILDCSKYKYILYIYTYGRSPVVGFVRLTTPQPP